MANKIFFENTFDSKSLAVRKTNITVNIDAKMIANHTDLVIKTVMKSSEMTADITQSNRHTPLKE